MKTLRPCLPSAVAVLMAMVVSIVVIELTSVILISVAVGLIGIAVAAVRSLRAKRSRWRALETSLVPAVLFVAIACSHLPLRLVFHVYRSQFDHAASQIEAGNPPATPFWIGPFRIKMANRRGDSGIPYLSTNKQEWEIDGFVRHPDGDGFNLWSFITLDDAWSYISED